MTRPAWHVVCSFPSMHCNHKASQHVQHQYHVCMEVSPVLSLWVCFSGSGWAVVWEVFFSFVCWQARCGPGSQIQGPQSCWSSCRESPKLVFLPCPPLGVKCEVFIWGSIAFYLETAMCRPLPCLWCLFWWNGGLNVLGWERRCARVDLCYLRAAPILSWLCVETFQVWLEIGQEPWCSYVGPSGSKWFFLKFYTGH